MTSQTALAAFDAAVTAALEAAAKNSPELVHKIDEVDTAYRQAEAVVGATVLRQRIWQTVLPELQKNPKLVATINFAASLTASGTQSVFFHTARTLCAEHAEEMPPEWLPGIVESFRRAGKYPEMQHHADLLRRKIGGDVSPQACKTLAKLDYELSMAAVQQAKAMYELAEVLANRSAAEAEQARDIPGKLYALMVVGGEVLPRLDRWKEGVALCEQVGCEAAAMVAQATETSARQRVERIVMNTLYYRLNMAVDHNGDVATVQQLVAAIEANPVYQMSRGEPWAEEPLERARAYVQSK